MRVRKIKVTKTNKFGDTYEIEQDCFIYDDDYERSTHRAMNYPMMDVKLSQIMDSVNEYFDMLQNSR